MKRIALVGEIGSGKTYVQKILVFQFLMQILLYQTYIKKIKKFLMF